MPGKCYFLVDGGNVLYLFLVISRRHVSHLALHLGWVLETYLLCCGSISWSGTPSIVIGPTPLESDPVGGSVTFSGTPFVPCSVARHLILPVALRNR